MKGKTPLFPTIPLSYLPHSPPPTKQKHLTSPSRRSKAADDAGKAQKRENKSGGGDVFFARQRVLFPSAEAASEGPFIPRDFNFDLDFLTDKNVFANRLGHVYLKGGLALRPRSFWRGYITCSGEKSAKIGKESQKIRTQGGKRGACAEGVRAGRREGGGRGWEGGGEV